MDKQNQDRAQELMRFARAAVHNTFLVDCPNGNDFYLAAILKIVTQNGYTSEEWDAAHEKARATTIDYSAYRDDDGTIVETRQGEVVGRYPSEAAYWRKSRRGY